MIVSITGATGFIGKRLVQRLHEGIALHIHVYCDQSVDKQHE